MAAIENLCGHKIFQVLVVSDNVDRGAGTIEVMAPYAERFKNGEEFLVMDVVVELCGVKRTGVKSDGVNFPIL